MALITNVIMAAADISHLQPVKDELTAPFL